MSAIKNIIFDLGGVLLNIDYNRTQQAFEAIGIEKFEAIYSQAAQSKLFDRYETGQMQEDDFLGQLLSYVPGHIRQQHVKDAWNNMLLDFPQERMHLLMELKKGYRTFLLSNTNETHISAFEKIIEKQLGIKTLDPLFEKVYFSSRIKKRKPDAEIFEYVLKENGLKKEETVFFDDSVQHIKGAESIGLKSILVQSPKTILDFFDSSYKLNLQ
ncbi:MAG TPA: HAD family phosphatase [Bacteroidia bacterium]